MNDDKVRHKETGVTNNIVKIQLKVGRQPKYPVYAFDMWMWFDSQSAYLDWQDRLEYGK